ncbi:glycoside hydrolase family 5 protein [Paenibacillaceae bacterium]|nr:glycoside hydrolase family 5 protein [Paenibacillaceae bacterium]
MRLRTDAQDVDGFVRAVGTTIVNGSNQEIKLRGVGLGSWLLPEGYMWQFPNAGDRPRRMEQMIEQLIGPDKASRFWSLYYDRYIAEVDIERIAEEGYNSVRVPINAAFLYTDRTWTVYHEAHLLLLDRLIGWCADRKIYVVLDLHGAPGGQTGTNIDDSEQDHPDLFTDERCQEATIALWRMLAERYKDEWIVAGYDLLNEPLPDWFASYNDRVMPLYRKIIAAIREVDQRHMIILEGVHWSTDWSIFEDAFESGPVDSNVMLQFHKYWNNPDTESIAHYLDMRERWQVPIYMGEGGENNRAWYTGAFRMFDDHGISWNFWTWKKMGKTNSPCEVRRPAGWDQLIAYLEGGEQPDAAQAETILWEYLRNIELEHCIYHADVSRALLRRVPFSQPAVFYGFKGAGVSYGPSAVSTDAVNTTGYRERDATTIAFVDGSQRKASFQHGGGREWAESDWISLELGPQQWAVYDFTLRKAVSADQLKVAIRLRSVAQTGSIQLLVNAQSAGSADVASAEWHSVTVPIACALESGAHELRITCSGAPVQLQWLELS